MGSLGPLPFPSARPLSNSALTMACGSHVLPNWTNSLLVSMVDSSWPSGYCSYLAISHSATRPEHTRHNYWNHQWNCQAGPWWHLCCSVSNSGQPGLSVIRFHSSGCSKMVGIPSISKAWEVMEMRSVLSEVEEWVCLQSYCSLIVFRSFGLAILSKCSFKALKHW